MENDLWNQILDLPVIVQGALGSFLFWLVFQILRWAFNYGFSLVSKGNKQTKNELLLYEALHHATQAFDTDSTSAISLQLIAIFSALNRFIQAILYICLGLISSYFLGEISLVAYIIAMFYLFLALKAVRLDFESSGLSQEDHLQEAEKIMSVITQNTDNETT